MLAIILLVLGPTGILLSGCGPKAEKSVSADQPDLAESASPITMPDGTVLAVRLMQTISSRTAQPGEEFNAELANDVALSGSIVFSKGAKVRGHVMSAEHSGRLQDPGFLRLTLDAIQLPNGKWIEIKTTSFAAKGESHKKRNLSLIGGGTGLGAVVGAIAGGGKGAAIGAASGAAAGTAGAYATGKKDVVLPVERRLSFKTVGPVVVS